MRDLTSLDAIFNALGLSDNVLINGELEVYSPIDGHVIARIDTDTRETVSNKIEKANKAYHSWRLVPAPKRGELIRLFGMELRKYKTALGALVTLESGKIYQEGLGLECCYGLHMR